MWRVVHLVTMSIDFEGFVFYCFCDLDNFKWVTQKRSQGSWHFQRLSPLLILSGFVFILRNSLLYTIPPAFWCLLFRRALNVFYQALFSLCQICSTLFLVMQEKVLKFLSGKYTELTFYSMLFDEIWSLDWNEFSVCDARSF